MEQTKNGATDCLDSREVAALLAGRLSQPDVSRVTAHLAECQACRDRVQAAGCDAASFTSEFRGSPDTGLGDSAPSKQLDLPTTEETEVDSQASAPKPVSLRFKFLSPAEAPGELGRLGGYRILRVIGEGGMGVVFEAQDPQLDRRVAIKVLKPEGLDASTRERFLQEARLAASLASERIVTIYQIGEDGGCPFIVMELLRGESLDTRLTRRGTLPLAEALRITREIAEGLAVAHDQGLIHRDIKPANVWLEQTRAVDAVPRVKLLDFGIARSLVSDARLTIEGRIVGTPSYLCPEQACHEPLDGRSDLFSLGCVLYAMLSGKSPFERTGMIPSIRAVVEEDPKPLASDVPPPVADLVKRMLSKSPQDRPASARQVVEEIRLLEQSFPAGSPTPPALPTAVRGTVAPPVRSKLGVGGWAGVAVLLLAVAVGLWTQYDRWLGSVAVQKANDPGGMAPGSAPASMQKGPVPAGQPSVPVALPSIRVGILHSLTGPMASSERSIVDAWLFAIDEINQSGGLLGGRKIEAVVRDGKSYSEVFAQQAEELIVKQRVVTLFGCWRSSCRKSVEVVCQQHDHLLVYPTGYEGLEESPYVIYMGGAPNQQIEPAIQYAYATLKKRKFFLIGTDGVFSRCAHEIMADEIAELGGQVVGNEYRGLSDSDFAPIAAQVKQSAADVVVNTVVGTGNIVLFSSLHKAGIKPDKVPVISFNVTEEELRNLSAQSGELAGDYAAWSYFQSLSGAANREFIERFRKRFGPARVVNDPMVAAYAGMHMWALAVADSRSDLTADIRRAFVRQQFAAPEGLVTINPENRHARRMALMGQVDNDYEYEVVSTSPKPVDPRPFPATRTRQQWEQLLESLYKEWGDHWGPEAAAP